MKHFLIFCLFLLWANIGTAEFANALTAEEKTNIITLCRDRFENDYEMQLYCQKKQIAAFEELSKLSPTINVNPLYAKLGGGNKTTIQAFKDAQFERDINGMVGVNDLIDSCYRKAEKAVGAAKLDAIRYCYTLHASATSMDLFNHEQRGKALNPNNSQRAVSLRFHKFMTTNGVSNKKISAIELVFSKALTAEMIK